MQYWQCEVVGCLEVGAMCLWLSRRKNVFAALLTEPHSKPVCGMDGGANQAYAPPVIIR